MVKKVAKREMSSLDELALEVLRFMQVVAMLDKLVLAGVHERVSGFRFPVSGFKPLSLLVALDCTSDC